MTPHISRRKPMITPNIPIKRMGRYQNISDWSGSPKGIMIALTTYMATKAVPSKLMTEPSMIANKQIVFFIWIRFIGFVQ
jgi:hypothetical protein